MLRALVHCESRIGEINLLQQALTDKQKVLEQISAAYEDRLKLAEERVQLANQKAEAEAERAAFYQSAYEKLLAIQKGPSFWCQFRRIFGSKCQ